MSDNSEFPRVGKIGHGKSSCKINIPIKLARRMGFDQSDLVLIVKRGEGKVEVKKYDKKEDITEYIQGNRTIKD